VLEGVSHLPFGRQQGASVYILECFIVITICGILPMIVLDIVVFLRVRGRALAMLMELTLVV
jgi:hypothetical protein